MHPTINFIGAGKLGKTLAYLINNEKLGTILGICNKNYDSSLETIKFLNFGNAYKNISDLPAADITFITTVDSSIREAALQLHKSTQLKPKSIVIHCSGLLTSNELEELKNKCFIASVHPMQSFAKFDSQRSLTGVYCAVEGDKDALNIVIPLLQNLGMITFQIKKESKPLYHAAGVFTSNYLITLINEAHNCLMKAGVENEFAFNIILQLLRSSIFNLTNKLDIKGSLTGPIERGDYLTITKHLENLSAEQLILYKTLGKATLKLVNHNQELQQKLTEIFS